MIKYANAIINDWEWWIDKLGDTIFRLVQADDMRKSVAHLHIYNNSKQEYSRHWEYLIWKFHMDNVTLHKGLPPRMPKVCFNIGNYMYKGMELPTVRAPKKTMELNEPFYLVNYVREDGHIDISSHINSITGSVKHIDVNEKNEDGSIKYDLEKVSEMLLSPNCQGWIGPNSGISIFAACHIPTKTTIVERKVGLQHPLIFFKDKGSNIILID